MTVIDKSVVCLKYRNIEVYCVWCIAARLNSILTETLRLEDRLHTSATVFRLVNNDSQILLRNSSNSDEDEDNDGDELSDVVVSELVKSMNSGRSAGDSGKIKKHAVDGHTQVRYIRMV